jgi:hypothetical protein
MDSMNYCLFYYIVYSDNEADIMSNLADKKIA